MAAEAATAPAWRLKVLEERCGAVAAVAVALLTAATAVTLLWAPQGALHGARHCGPYAGGVAHADDDWAAVRVVPYDVPPRRRGEACPSSTLAVAFNASLTPPSGLAAMGDDAPSPAAFLPARSLRMVYAGHVYGSHARGKHGKRGAFPPWLMRMAERGDDRRAHAVVLGADSVWDNTAEYWRALERDLNRTFAHRPVLMALGNHDVGQKPNGIPAFGTIARRHRRMGTFATSADGGVAWVWDNTFASGNRIGPYLLLHLWRHVDALAAAGELRLVVIFVSAVVWRDNSVHPRGYANQTYRDRYAIVWKRDVLPWLQKLRVPVVLFAGDLGVMWVSHVSRAAPNVWAIGSGMGDSVRWLGTYLNLDLQLPRDGPGTFSIEAVSLRPSTPEPLEEGVEPVTNHTIAVPLSPYRCGDRIPRPRRRACQVTWDSETLKLVPNTT